MDRLERSGEDVTRYQVQIVDLLPAARIRVRDRIPRDAAGNIRHHAILAHAETRLTIFVI